MSVKDLITPNKDSFAYKAGKEFAKALKNKSKVTKETKSEKVKDTDESNAIDESKTEVVNKSNAVDDTKNKADNKANTTNSAKTKADNKTVANNDADVYVKTYTEASKSKDIDEFMDVVVEGTKPNKKAETVQNNTVNNATNGTVNSTINSVKPTSNGPVPLKNNSTSTQRTPESDVALFKSLRGNNVTEDVEDEKIEILKNIVAQEPLKNTSNSSISNYDFNPNTAFDPTNADWSAYTSTVVLPWEQNSAQSFNTFVENQLSPQRKSEVGYVAPGVYKVNSADDSNGQIMDSIENPKKYSDDVKKAAELAGISLYSGDDYLNVLANTVNFYEYAKASNDSVAAEHFKEMFNYTVEKLKNEDFATYNNNIYTIKFLGAPMMTAEQLDEKIKNGYFEKGVDESDVNNDIILISEPNKDADAMLYALSRMYEIRFFEDEFGYDWTYATIEDENGNIAEDKVPSSETLKNIAMVAAKRGENIIDNATGYGSSEEFNQAQISKNLSPKLSEEIEKYDDEIVLEKKDDGRYYINVLPAEDFTAEEIAQMAIIYEESKDNQKLNRYFSDFVEPRKSGELSENILKFYNAANESDNPFFRALAVSGGLISGLALLPETVGESIGSTIIGAETKHRPNENYGLLAPAWRATNTGRAENLKGLVSDVADVFVDEAKADNFAANVYAPIDSALVSSTNMLLGPLAPFANAMQSMAGTLDEGILQRRDSLKTLAKAVSVTGMEFVTELIQLKGFEDILKKSPMEKNILKRFKKNVSANFANELPGELLSSGFEIGIDNVLYDEDSDMNRTIREWMEKGTVSSYSEGLNKYLGNSAKDTALSTFVSAVLLGGVPVIADPKNKSAESYKEYGNLLRSQGIDIELLAKQAKHSEESVTQEYANKVLENPEGIKDEELGFLYLNAKEDVNNGKLDPEVFSVDGLYHLAVKKIKDSNKVGDLINIALQSNDDILNQLAEQCEMEIEENGKLSDESIAELYRNVAEKLFAESVEFIESINESENNISETVEGSIEKASNEIKEANKTKDKNEIFVKLSDGNTVSAKGEYLAKVGGDKIYTVKGSDIGLDNGFYAVDSRTGDTIASGETKSVIREQLNVLKESGKTSENAVFDDGTENIFAYDIDVPIDFDSLERNVPVVKSENKTFEGTDVEDIFSVEDDNSETAKKSGDDGKKTTVTLISKDGLKTYEGISVAEDTGYELTAVERNGGITIVEKRSGMEFAHGATVEEAVANVRNKIAENGKDAVDAAIEKAIERRKASVNTSAGSTSSVEGDRLSVGRAVADADYTNTLLEMAKTSKNEKARKAAALYSSYDFKNDTERYRALGDIAKMLGVSEADLVKSRAKSLFAKISASISSETDVVDKTNAKIYEERQAAVSRGDTATVKALDYLTSLLNSEGGIISVSEMFAPNQYSAENPNVAVQVYGKRMETAFKNIGLDISVSVYYDNSENAARGEWTKRPDGHSEIKLNGAKLQGEQSAFWVVSHELIHEAESKSPGITQRMLDAFTKMGMYSEEQFEAYKARYNAVYEAEFKRELDRGNVTQDDHDEFVRNYVNEEIVADLMSETMSSSELVEVFAGKFGKDDANVIVSFLKKLLNGVKKVFNSKDEFPNKFSDIIGMFEGAIKGKVDGRDSAEKTADTKKALAEIDAERITSNELDTRYSLTHNEDIAKGELEYIRNNKSSITEAELKDAQEVTRAMVDVMMKYSEILPEDKIGKVLTKNGSYDRSVENTTICVRTLAYNEFVDKVQEELGRPLTQMESFLVSQKMYDIATDPQCLYCYVSLDRKAFNDMLLRYMQDRDTVIAKYNDSNKSPEAIAEIYEEFLRGRKDTKEMKARFNGWLDLVDNGTQLLSLADIATEDRQRTITADGGNLAQQLKDARKYAQTASWAKIQKDYVAYRDEILKLGDKVVKNLNEHYGLRWYSFSDYSAAFIVENMQQITDASIRGLKGLAYTKDTDFVEIFASTGMNINISVFVNQDKDGNFFIDEKQSANFEKAVELRKKYPNVGIVATVTNDEAMAWAGKQEWSDVIIPFHIVRTGTDVAEYYNWLNYTNESGDTIADKNLWEAYVNSLNLSSENARKKVSKNIYPSEHKNDKDTYLSLCESRGLSPRFARFIGEDWYMKLVNETRLSADEFSALKPEFNLKAAKESFQKFIDKGGYKGSWYKEGVDVESEAKVVAEDVRAGKKANEVEYGRQDGYNPEEIAANRKKNRGHEGDKKYALDKEVLDTEENSVYTTNNRIDNNVVYRGEKNDTSGNNNNDVGKHIETQANEQKRGVSQRSADGFNRKSKDTQLGQKHIGRVEKRTIEDIVENQDFIKISNFVGNEITKDVALKLFSQYELDSRVNKEYFEFIDVATYDMLSNEKNSLRSIFEDQISEYFNADKSTNKDSTGADLPDSISEEDKKTIVKNEFGQLIPMYHGTDRYYDVLKSSDVGIHLGNYAQAFKRTKDKQIETPVFIKGYAIIKKPLPLKTDIDVGVWDAKGVLTQMDGSLLNDEQISDIFEFYNKKDIKGANEKLVSILKSKGYDGIEYNNEFEAVAGKSYIIFDDSQFIRIENNNQDFETDIRYSLDDTGVYSLEDAWAEMTKKYGAIPKGEKAARDVKVPKKISDNKYVSRTARSAIEAGITPAEFVPELQKEILDGKFTYERFPDEKAEAKAKETIEYHGFEGALEHWEFLMHSGGAISKENFSLGIALYNQCAQNGDFARAEKILADLSVEATRAGQAIQSMRLLKKMSADGTMYYLEKSIDKINDELVEKFGEKRAKKVKINEELARKYFAEKDAKKREKLYDELCKDIGEQIPSTFWEKADAWRYFAMLFNPTTHIRNFFGNVFNKFVVMVDHAVEGALQPIFVKQENRTRTWRIADEKTADFAKNDWELMKDVLTSGEGKYNNMMSDIDKNRRILRPSKNAGKVTKVVGNTLGFIPEVLRKFNSWGLEAEDAIFLGASYKSALRKIITARKLNVDNITPEQLSEIRDLAIKDALRATFREANWLAEGISKTRSNLMKGNAGQKLAGIALGGVFPFTKTPMNITKQALEHSPLGVFKTASDIVKKARGGAVSGNDIVADLARTFTGTGLAVLGFVLARAGFVSAGDDEDPDKKRFDKLVGEQSYAITIGGKSYTIDWATPASIPFLVGAQLFDATSDSGISIKTATDSLTKIAEPVIGLSMLDGLRDFMQSDNYAEGQNPLFAGAYSTLESYVLQFFPTLGGKIHRIYDGEKKNYYFVDKNSNVPEFVQELYGSVASKLPFAVGDFQPSVDLWGRVENHGGIGERLAENLISPGYYSEENYTEVDEELLRLYESTGNGDVFPKKMYEDITIDSHKYYMNAEHYTEAAIMLGERRFDMLSRLFNDEIVLEKQNVPYSEMSDSEKAKIVSDVYYQALNETKYAMFDKVRENSAKYGDVPELDSEAKIRIGAENAEIFYNGDPTGENAYNYEIYSKANDFLKKTDNILADADLSDEERKKAEADILEYANAFPFEGTRGGELAAAFYDKIYNNGKPKFDIEYGDIFSKYSEYIDVDATIDGKKYKENLSVGDYLELSTSIAAAEEILRITMFGTESDVSTYAQPLMEQYKNEPWMQIVKAASENIPKKDEDKAAFYKSVMSDVRNGIKNSYDVKYIKEASSGNDTVDRLAISKDMSNKAYSAAQNGATGAQRVYWTQKYNFANQAYKAIQGDKSSNKAGYIKDLETLSEKYDGKLSRGDKLIAENYDKVGNDDVFYTGAESYVLEKSKDGIKYEMPMSYHDYKSMTKYMDDAMEYAALYVFGNDSDKSSASKIRNQNDSMEKWVADGLKAASSAMKGNYDLYKKGKLSADEYNAIYYKTLVGKIKSEIRADYRESYFKKSK